MRYALLLAAPLLIAAAGDMSVATFLTKADALQRKGMLALMSSDLKLVVNEGKGAAAAYERNHKAAKARGEHHALGCPPKGTKYGQKDFMADMRAIPAAERGRTSVTQALTRGMARRFPCRA